MFLVVAAASGMNILLMSPRLTVVVEARLPVLCSSEGNPSEEGSRQRSAEGVASQSAPDRGRAGDL